MGVAALTPSDAMALTMVALLAFSLGMILTILWVMARNAGKRPDYEPDLTEDLPESRLPGKKPGSNRDEDPAPREAWEKDGDWWK